MRILLSGKNNLQNYVEALKALGVAKTLIYTGSADDDADGLLLCGGGDIDPSFYHQRNDASVGIDVERDKAELALIERFVKEKKPVFGICRGHQIINVYFGGTLYQHLDRSHLHTADVNGDKIHGVRALSDCIVGRLYGEEFTTNSSHHQAVDRIGEGLRATSFSLDGCIESCEHLSLPVFSVQWHPERTCFSKKRTDTVDGAEILAYFLSLCQEKKQEKRVK